MYMYYNVLYCTCTCTFICLNVHFSVQVYVVPPSGLSFVACRVEVVVGQKLLLPLQVLGHTLEDIPTSLPFYDCRFMKLNLALSDDAIFNVTMDTNTGD